MKHLLLISVFLISSLSVFAQNQNGKAPDPYEIAQKEYDRINKRLGIKPEQEFYVDSTLVHNFSKMMEEVMVLQMGGMERPETYEHVRDKWNDRTLEAFKKIFDKEQYYNYMMMIGKGKEIRAERKAYLKAKKEAEKKKEEEKE